MTERIVLIVLDSVGVGELSDAVSYNDAGTDTIGHIFDRSEKPFSLPNMAKLGLYKLLNRRNSLPCADVTGCYGKMMTKSPAKDTMAGHWEMSGIILPPPFPVYPRGFPKKVIEEFEKQIGAKIIGNCSASGTEIIKRFGSEHLKTGCPIIYTSADSVFQIAVHEETFGLDRLYKICEIARNILCGGGGML
ncbi:MAG: hypothetical protein Ta2C_05870 [Candidatus Endomicrobiellum trichonymphae]|nr:MAG: hypothetical protein Ta2C_05870 [Candidatus Endomicrobium trichonymphae]